MSDDLAAFLLARFDEDEALANGASQDPMWEQTPILRIAQGAGLTGVPGTVSHIFRHDPARVLRDVEAKRRVLDRHEPFINPGARRYQCWHDDQYWPCADVMSLASIYSDHPDYRAEWALD